ncbi:NAD(P)/FAD-dependent oxidoreductase [Nigerium massiliense]|uniref:NAD(P)/FAD-dependent oxidoreductase n=1 Tax=Nigerium massiliense TaxID=1522317 RepID=UPI00059033C0|nr:NAD(P)/FAD-dependent oxidoreductase [Nigerium massiliense]
MERFGRRRPHVVIIGSGFGGLFASQALKDADVDITLISRTGHHLFQPLLYQVATGILSSGEIAPSTREVLRHQKNVRVVLGEVGDIDVEAREVHWTHAGTPATSSYDYVIVAAGTEQSFFGHDEFATFAPGMKTIDDALELRSRIFGAFEQAEVATDPDVRRRLLTFCVVGGGPTGVEMAGQIRELASRTLASDFRSFDPRCTRVLLIDGGDQLLKPFGERLGRRAQRDLEKRGVEVKLQSRVVDLDYDGLTLRTSDGSTQRIESSCKVWAAGVRGNSLGRTLADQTGVALKGGRVVVGDDLSLPGHPEVFVIGDLMAKEGVPGMAQGAIQSGRYVARIIAARTMPDGDAKDAELAKATEPFSYFDKGSMATIAKFSGVAKIGKIELTGFIAWVAWLAVHLLSITGFKQRLSTLLSWAISFIGTGRSERTSTDQQLLGRLALEDVGTDTAERIFRGETPLVLHEEQPAERS